MRAMGQNPTEDEVAFGDDEDDDDDDDDDELVLILMMVGFDDKNVCSASGFLFPCRDIWLL